MKQLLATVVFAAMLAGCMTQEMSSTPFYTGGDVKYTDKVEDRVSLWPLLYHRAPVTSVLWPLFSSADDHVAVRPLYSQYMKHGKREYNEYNVLWPIAQFDTCEDDYRVFPFFWGKDYDDDPYFCLFPEIWWNDEFAGAFPFFWLRDRDGRRGFSVFPLYWHGHDRDSQYGFTIDTLFPLYFYEHKTGSRDRVNFWALCKFAGYRREGDETPHHWLAPLYLRNRLGFYSLPYSRYRDGGTLKSRVLCGLAGMDSNPDGDYRASWLFPLYSHDKAKGAFITPLYGNTKSASWLIPLYYKGEAKFLTLLGGKDGDVDWVVPCYWCDQTTFASLLYWRQLGRDGEIDRAFSIPLLSGYERDHTTGDRLLYLLLGLGGRVWNDETGGASWVFPLYYRDRESFYTLLYGQNPSRRWLLPLYFEGPERMYVTPLYGRNKQTGADWLIPLYYRDAESFVTPLFGKSGDSSWLLPLYCRDESQFNSPVLSYWDDAKNGERGFFSLPLLSGASWKTNSCDKTWFALAGLVGGATDASGARRSQWLAPLYYRDEDSFFSIPCGWSGCGSCTNTYFAAGLVGLKSGSKDGFWVAPICSYEHYGDFDRINSIANSPTLPADVTFHEIAYTNVADEVSVRLREDRQIPCAKTKTKVAVFFTPYKHWASTWLTWDGDEYGVRDTVERGNEFVFNRERTHEVKFDPRTRAKKDECVHEKAMLGLGALYNSSRTESGRELEEESKTLFGLLYDRRKEVNKVKGTSFEEASVLLKVWHRAEKNGDVSLDVFPGFTYDAKKNGYRKTSFLWRLFRYENDPEQGRKVDLFFIPVWR